MQVLYPPIKSYQEHYLSVDATHTIYIAECGNPTGIPVLVVHGGPGNGCDTYHRRFFDPERYRIILFDQRGAGLSSPHTALKDNTTEHLIQDIEKIRRHLSVEKWILFGGSWGAALSLLYAERYPQNVSGLILHRIFLARAEDIQWFYQSGANLIFPDYWEDFIQNFSFNERKNLLKSYQKHLNGSNEFARMAAAKSWSLWQARCTALQPHHDLLEHFADPHFATQLAIIENHYFANDCFIAENAILKNIEAIARIPGYIIHGRYDMVCPLKGAWQLHQAWPKAELCIIRDAGHSIKEPGVIDALVLATKNMLSSGHRPA